MTKQAKNFQYTAKNFKSFRDNLTKPLRAIFLCTQRYLDANYKALQMHSSATNQGTNKEEYFSINEWSYAISPKKIFLTSIPNISYYS